MSVKWAECFCPCVQMNCYNRNVLLRIFNLTFACIHRDGWIGHKVPVHIYCSVLVWRCYTQRGCCCCCCCRFHHIYKPWCTIDHSLKRRNTCHVPDVTHDQSDSAATFMLLGLHAADSSNRSHRPTPFVMTMFRDPVLRVTLIAKHIVDDGDFATIKRKIKSWHSYKCIGLSP